MDPLELSSRKAHLMLSSAAREERTAHRIYRDISSLQASVDCLSSKINSHLGRISRLREEHRELTGSIARKKQIFTSWASARKRTDIKPETSLQSSGRKPSDLDVVDLTCSESLTPEHTDGPDTLCCGTPLQQLEPWNDPTLDVNGIMDYLELENLDWPTNDCQMPMSKTHSPNGGLDIC